VGLLKDIGSFGDVAAEQDAAVLSYFLKTDAVEKIESGSRLMVLGRKGSGKTALTKYFSQSREGYLSESLSLTGYPWQLHQSKVNSGASHIEAYVSAWKYLICLKANAQLIKAAGTRMTFDTQRAAHAFLFDNYGGAEPTLADVLRPQRLVFSKAVLRPTIMGNSVGELNFDSKDGGISPDIDLITEALLANALTMNSQMGYSKLFLHFDELDQGLSELDDIHKKMLIGLVLAARSIIGRTAHGTRVIPIIYLRTDLWDEMQFSDKNKISQSSSIYLEWNPDSLKELINRRIEAKLGSGKSWNDIDDSALMRGSQSKWSHIVARTFLRPRDVIQFLNYTLEYGLKTMEDGDVFENSDIIAAREPYSRYLKQELDDEIGPHWPQWAEAVQALSEMATMTFGREEFDQAWSKRRASKDRDADSALETLYQFSVIGYRRGIGSGGSGWTFQYTDPDAGWDNAATRMKVHSGLKEFAKLREERAQ
jgi:hypothetical protein